jgi:flagellar biogenesis protein FliO
MERSNGIQIVRGVKHMHKRSTFIEPNGVAGWIWTLLRSWRSSRETESKQLHLVETLSLGGKKQLMLVSCAGQQFLVGGGLESVETMIRVNDEASQGVTAKKLDETCL